MEKLKKEFEDKFCYQKFPFDNGDLRFSCASTNKKVWQWIIEHFNPKESNLLEKLVSQPSELLPCPFCGGKVNGFHRRKNWEDAYMVSCLNCGIDTPKLKTQELAKELWNKRASQAAPQAMPNLKELTNK